MKFILMSVFLVTIIYADADRMYKFKNECEEYKNGAICFDIGNAYLNEDIEQAKQYFEKACKLEAISGCIALFNIEKKLKKGLNNE